MDKPIRAGSIVLARISGKLSRCVVRRVFVQTDLAGIPDARVALDFLGRIDPGFQAPEDGNLYSYQIARVERPYAELPTMRRREDLRLV